MITSEKIQGLARLRSPSHWITSLYLRLWPEPRIHRNNAKDLIKEKRERLSREGLSKEEIRSWENEVEDLRKFIDTLRDVSYRGVVFFLPDP